MDLHCLADAGCRAPISPISSLGAASARGPGWRTSGFTTFATTYASMALSSGQTIRTVGRLLGHDNAATTLKYAHLSDTAVRETVEALAPLLSGAQS